jgi:NAD(P)-dependent dehydrogenase (short-subunit alcohol dehydrogenase family)
MMPTVLITGSSSGFGKEAALAFARAGYRVSATLRDMRRSEGLREAAAGEGLELAIEELDITRPGLFASFVDRLVAREGRIDVLVNNAGVLPVGAFEDIDETELRAVMETNFFGPALLTKAVLPVMRRQRSGYIIMLSSLSGLAAKAGDSVYCASKFALEGLTEGLRQEVARWNIRTALVQPAQYATGMFRTTAEGSLGACSPDSPYYPLISRQQDALRAALPGGRDPRVLAQLLVEIARSDGSRFRWPADDVAERVTRTMFAQDDAERQAFLRGVAGVDWWIEGAEAPEAGT